MAFFKFRKSGEEPSTAPAQPESVEEMRRRAKHRLMGAAVLLLVGVIGFPLLFDKQPRPISVDTPIEIPDRNKARSLNIPAPAALNSIKSDAVAPASSSPLVAASEPAVEQKVPEKTAQLPAPAASKAVASVKSASQPTDKVADKAAPKSDDGAKAQALLEGREAEKKADGGDGRFVVQIGAFADTVRAREARMKVERAGLKTYTQVVGTKESPRIRVRIGPFRTKAEADKTAEKVKRLDLPAAILSL